ncbi:MAG: Uma2 family endonuclease [Phycisphaeraceae bacterium]
MTSVSNKMTVEEFEVYAAKHGRCELIHGEVREMTPASYEHGDVTGQLHFYIAEQVIPKRLGKLLAAETGFRLDDEQGPVVRAPDIAFVSNERLPDEPPQSFATFAPDLVVETTSPGDTQSQVMEKVLWWLSKGVREAWVADPANKTIALHWPDGTSRRYLVEQVLDGSRVLPELAIELTLVFTR